MDLHTQEREVTAKMEDAFVAWVTAQADEMQLYNENCEIAEGRLSKFWRQLGTRGEHYQAGLLQQGCLGRCAV